MNHSSREAGIPVLTEIIAAPGSAEQTEPQPEIAEGDHETVSRDPQLVPDPQHQPQLSREDILLELENHFEISLGTRIQARVLQKLQQAAVEIAEDVKREMLREIAELRASGSLDLHDQDFKNQ